MTVAEYLIAKLVENKATDIFGIPGGVVLDFLYTADKTEGIKLYLSYHEQAAAFEAVGYAQVNHSLGVAYATRGPGLTNLITGIADAYADSVPVLFITGHSGKTVGHNMRFEKEQELDSVSMVQHITKYADVVENAADCWKIDRAIKMALSGRKGPVMLDFSSDVWRKEIAASTENRTDVEIENDGELNLSKLQEIIKNSKRPIVLVGDGIRQSGTYEELQNLLNLAKMPIISSRGSQDIAAGSEYYFGYIGSHGIRYANMIFDKADLVVSLGNRMAFPVTSETYKKSIEGKRFVQIEIDRHEIKTEIPNLTWYVSDLSKAIEILKRAHYYDYIEWIKVCRTIKQELEKTDINEIVESISMKLKSLTSDTIIVCDVGNNEFWSSRAYELAGIKNRALFSKSFGVLGCGIPKGIGAALSTGKPVLVIVGDQGLQLNIQELQFIKQHELLMEILVINNRTSGMIDDREKSKYGYEIHTTVESGYKALDIKKIADAYNLSYGGAEYPMISEIVASSYTPLEPSVPRGNRIYDMEPAVDHTLMKRLEQL